MAFAAALLVLSWGMLGVVWGDFLGCGSLGCLGCAWEIGVLLIRAREILYSAFSMELVLCIVGVCACVGVADIGGSGCGGSGVAREWGGAGAGAAWGLSWTYA